MKFGVIGLGSMGSRRIRCLKRLGYEEIVVYDVDEDRRRQAVDEYGVEAVETVDDVDVESLDALVISTPPFAHNEYIDFAISNDTPAFVEASVLKEGLSELSTRAKERGVLIAPSCTMRYHPAVRDISSIVSSGEFGDVTSFSYHMGQYLPDWHPWEDVQDFYVSREDTAATREMVPFEMMWLVEVVGYPESIEAKVGPSGADIGADIDDVYAMAMACETGFGTVLIDVVARHATRRLILNLESGQILWSWNDDIVKVYDAGTDRWIDYHQPTGEAEAGYHPNIQEDMYVNETAAFVDAVEGQGTFPHSLDDDIRILELLDEVEE